MSDGNRELSLHSTSSKQKYIVMSDVLFRKMLWRGACVAVPMFFGKSEDEVGVRDVADIMHRMLIMRPP
ncbi:unnamed protein product [Brassica rapa]|uniref:Uncharacterized protein n=2 Tax=Brassica TaxID=3705 RepID=A0A3P5ZZM3_BRACM|nr:unnamed protein product [Brassica napus]CAG7880933.1 unnamed protein product [Brassica rapa]CDY35436.1 BnaA03g19240D [Brassica napus]VDC80303.1 unnamed protein product [Brassica rapa]